MLGGVQPPIKKKIKEKVYWCRCGTPLLRAIRQGCQVVTSDRRPHSDRVPGEAEKPEPHPGRFRETHRQEGLSKP